MTEKLDPLDNTPEPLREILARNIRATAGAAGINQTELVALLGVTRPWVSRRWRGTQDSTTADVDRIAVALNVSTDRLTRREG